MEAVWIITDYYRREHRVEGKQKWQRVKLIKTRLYTYSSLDRWCQNPGFVGRHPGGKDSSTWSALEAAVPTSLVWMLMAC